MEIQEPEFYLEMDPMSNAYAFGDTQTAITITSSLVEMMSHEELRAVVARFAGGPKSITSKVNMLEWAKQADEYEKIYNGSTWNKTLQRLAVIDQSHPFSAVRVREILKWKESEQYHCAKENTI